MPTTQRTRQSATRQSERQRQLVKEFYHGTSLDAALAIQAGGFQLDKCGSNAGAALGQGVYVTTTLQKAMNYAQRMPHSGVILKLHVDLGRCKVLQKNDPMMKSWQHNGYDSAYAAAGVIGQEEENCIKDPVAITIVDFVFPNTKLARQAGFDVHDRRLCMDVPALQQSSARASRSPSPATPSKPAPARPTPSAKRASRSPSPAAPSRPAPARPTPSAKQQQLDDHSKVVYMIGFFWVMYSEGVQQAMTRATITIFVSVAGALLIFATRIVIAAKDALWSEVNWGFITVACPLGILFGAIIGRMIGDCVCILFFIALLQQIWEGLRNVATTTLRIVSFDWYLQLRVGALWAFATLGIFLMALKPMSL